MEQNIQENELIMLRYKFCAFFDLKPRVRRSRLFKAFLIAQYTSLQLNNQPNLECRLYIQLYSSFNDSKEKNKNRQQARNGN